MVWRLPQSLCSFAMTDVIKVESFGFCCCLSGNPRFLAPKPKNCVYIIYRYRQILEKTAIFCRFFALSVLFFIKLFYLCTDFRDQPVGNGCVTKVAMLREQRGGGRNREFFEKTRKKCAKILWFHFFSLTLHRNW